MSIFSPADRHNETLKRNVLPDDWTNPSPPGKYNLVVIGGGPAGLICAAGAAGLGARVALVERSALGGDCLNVGCVPSKALIRSARAAHEVRTAEERFGVNAKGAEIDFPAVMERMRRLRAGISPVDSARRYSEELGVDVYLGEARFGSRNTVEVGCQSLRFARAVIATGARAARIPIPGLWENGAHTNESIFSLTELPRRLAVIGAGPIGCELAQCFARFGSAVTLLDAAPSLLPLEHPEAGALVAKAFKADGMALMTGVQITGVESRGHDRVIRVNRDGRSEEVVVDEILVGAGRTPNVRGLGLSEAGVDYTEQGVITNDRLQTSNKRIYAAGDVALDMKFTHTADASARVVLQNALFHGRKKMSKLVVPRCTYTDPEVAHVGLSEEEATSKGLEIETFHQDLHHIDRAILDGEREGFVKVHVRKGSSRIVGATVVASHAGDLVAELSLAMTHGLGLDQLAATVHCYPTQAEAIKRVGDAYNRTRLTPLVAGILKRLLAWQRR